MSKSCIIAVTAGDFEYIDEWIEYHHNLGVSLFLIGYNGPSDKIRNYKQRDYVRFIDFSYNDTNLDDFKNGAFSGWSDNNVYGHYRMEKIANMLLNYARWFYQDYDYAIHIDTDEFIKIKTGCDNINTYLDDHFPVMNSSISIVMNFATDNNLIYKDDRPVLERFTEFCNQQFKEKGCRKIIIRLKHKDVIDNKIVYQSPHSCSLYIYGFDLDFGEIELSHYWTKSLEEWIEKMDTSVDQDYFNRFKGIMFECYFFGGAHNKLTKEKCLAIPELLRKYNIDYDFLKEETPRFVEEYLKVINEKVESI